MSGHAPSAPDKSARAASGIPALLRGHPLVAFYALAFAISWAAIVLVVGPGGLVGTGATIAVADSVSLAGPSIAGVLMTGLVDGKAGLRQLVARLRRWRVGGRWYAVALLTCPVVMGAGLVGLSLLSPEYRPDVATADDKLGIVLVGIASGLAVGFFEELGWTGFALPRLRRRHGVLTTGLVMGLLWSAWHFPFFAGTTDPEGTVARPVLVAVLLFAWLPAYRVLMVWVYDRTKSLLLAMLMHAPITTFAFVVASEGKSGSAVMVQVLVWGASFWAIVAIVAWANGGRLTRPREKAARLGAPV